MKCRLMRFAAGIRHDDHDRYLVDVILEQVKGSRCIVLICGGDKFDVKEE